MGVIALLGFLEMAVLPDMLDVCALPDVLDVFALPDSSVTPEYTPLSATLGNAHTVDLEDSRTDTGTHRFLKLKKDPSLLQNPTRIHRNDPTMLADGGGGKSGIRIARKNLIHRRMWMDVISAYDVSFLRTTRLTDTKESSILVVIVYR